MTATATYGHISTWDTSAVTDMSLLFSRYDADWNDVGGLYCSTYDTFDDDISAWQGTWGFFILKVYFAMLSSPLADQ